MAKDTGRNDRRSRIAYLAARLMAEDGIEDYALAKRKAARQAGEPDTRELPGNEEIDEALRTYRQIYHPEAHRERWRGLLETAVRAMRELARFNPYLTGSVLNGNAGKYADVNLQLFTDNEKAVELYLLDRGIPYRTAQSRLYSGDEMRTVPVYTVSDQGIDIELTVLSMLDLRGPLRTSPDGKSIERAKLLAVEQLLADA
ncbi:MAG TPA: hypothetical protein VLD15_06120 [Burkholderiales bacterium]|nr:hypothetical protein [Burkholderiales bacterium]